MLGNEELKNMKKGPSEKALFSDRVKQRVTRFFLSFGFLVFGAVTLLIAILFWQFSESLPKLISIADYRPAIVTQVVTSEGNSSAVLAEYFRERRFLVPFEKIPAVVSQAFISAEDDGFFEHEGISLLAMLRASIANFRAGHVVQGGSTITQQLAKSLFLSPERSFIRKIKEVILAYRMEKNLSKEQILYLYLNQIYLGHGAYGIQAAAKSFYNKDVSELALEEVALLAGLPRAPSKYSPFSNPKRAKERQVYVLRRMFQNKYITEQQMTEAVSKPLRVFHRTDVQPPEYYYWVEHIRRYLVEKYGEAMVYEQGLKAVVPASVKLLEASQSTLQDGLRVVDKRLGFRGPVSHLGTEAEQSEFLTKARERLMRKRVPFELLLPDGTIDLEQAVRDFGIQSEESLLSPGELVEALVVEVHDAQRTVKVKVGSVLLPLDMEQLTWAFPLDIRTKGNRALEIPSKLVKPGDVVWVKVVRRVLDKQKNTRMATPLLEAQLEQIPEIQGAIFSLDVKTGYVLTLQGGYEFSNSEFNRATQAKRQPGSAFKPVIYSVAVENGFTPASILVDSPVVYKDEEAGNWKPTNYEEKFHGDTTLLFSFVKSRNIPTIKLVQSLQVPKVINYARRIGFTGDLSQDLSISLGSASVTLEELTSLYAVYPRMGRKVRPIYLLRVEDRDGKVLEENRPQEIPASVFTSFLTASPPTPEPAATGSPAPAAGATTVPSGFPEEGKPRFALPQYPLESDPDQVMDPRVAYVMTHLMKEVINIGTGVAAKELGRPAAGKTGTTNEYKDAWFIGFTPYMATGVWVGFDDQRNIGPGETGAKAALPIWISFMKEAIRLYPEEDFQIPPGITFASIDLKNGHRLEKNSPGAREEAFIEGTEPIRSVIKSQMGFPDPEREFLKEDLN